MMNFHTLLTKYPIVVVVALLLAASALFYYGVVKGIIIILLALLFYYILFHVLRIYKELFKPNNPKFKIKKMLKGKVVFDNNIWMEEEYEDIFKTVEYLCKKESYKVVLFKIQLEEIANIRNKAKIEESEEFKMAELAIKRIESFQKGKILTLEDKIAKEPSSEPQKEELELPPNAPNELVIKLENNKAAPAKPALPGDPKEQIHKSLLIESLVTRLSDKPIYTYVSLNPELRVRLRAYLSENSDKKVEIIEVGGFRKLTDYVDRWRPRLLEKFLKSKFYKHITTSAKTTKKLYGSVQKLKKD